MNRLAEIRVRGEKHTHQSWRREADWIRQMSKEKNTTTQEQTPSLPWQFLFPLAASTWPQAPARAPGPGHSIWSFQRSAANQDNVEAIRHICVLMAPFSLLTANGQPYHLCTCTLLMHETLQQLLFSHCGNVWVLQSLSFFSRLKEISWLGLSQDAVDLHIRAAVTPSACLHWFFNAGRQFKYLTLICGDKLNLLNVGVFCDLDTVTDKPVITCTDGSPYDTPFLPPLFSTLLVFVVSRRYWQFCGSFHFHQLLGQFYFLLPGNLC